MASVVLVNSQFTRGVYEESFPLIKYWFPDQPPRILYPAIKETNYVLPDGYDEDIWKLIALDEGN